MNHALLPIASALLLVACGNPAVQSGHCDRQASDMTSPQNRPLMLTDSALDKAPLAHLPGGFLVYDEIGLETFSATGDLAKSTAPNRKCSALLVPRMRESRAYFDVTSAESCLRPFVWSALNQRILLSVPGTTDYQQFKVKDARVLAVPSLFALMAPLPQKARTRAVDASTLERIGAQGYYTADYKGWPYQSPESTAFLKDQCAESGKATPVPENCLWFLGHMPDSIEVELSAENKATFESLAEASAAFEQESAKKLDRASPALGKRISEYNSKMLSFQKNYDDVVLAILGPTLLSCKDAKETDPCYGTTLEQRKEFTISLLKLYRPSWIADYEAAFAGDQAASKTAFRKKNDAIFLEGIKTNFAPAVESYYEFRKEFIRRKDLITILSNHLDGTKLELEKFNYRALSPFAYNTPKPLTGIMFSFKEDNVFMTHPGVQTNQNLALDGHIGSVFAFGGLPILGFGPANIDQSDATSVMPIPKTSARATTAAEQRPSRESSKTTVGEGKADKGC
jgi:hypothetical protein